MKANMSQWQWVQHWLNQTRNAGPLLPSGRQQAKLVDSGTDHIVTSIDAFMDFVPIQSVVRNPNEEASRVVGRGCVRISIPSNKGEFNANSKIFCVCRTILQTSYQSQDARSGDIASLSREETAA